MSQCMYMIRIRAQHEGLTILAASIFVTCLRDVQLGQQLGKRTGVIGQTVEK